MFYSTLNFTAGTIEYNNCQKKLNRLSLRVYYYSNVLYTVNQRRARKSFTFLRSPLIILMHLVCHREHGLPRRLGFLFVAHDSNTNVLFRTLFV
jgi:hypothetical protein